MNNLLKLATAFAAGAAVMYYFDPNTGRRRRALARDQGVAAGHDLEDLARAKSKRAADRMRGTMAEARAHMADKPVGDRQLHDRIRAKLGRLIEDPGEVEVDVHGGHVVLSGNVKAAELDELVNFISGMRGVEDVESQLTTDIASADAEPEREAEAAPDARH